MSPIYLTGVSKRLPYHAVTTVFTRSAMVAALLFSAAAHSSSIKAATINVTALDDTLVTNGVCSIREAIINANNDAATWLDCAAGSGTDTINLPAGIITLTIPNSPSPFSSEELSLTGDLDITSPVTINGNAAGTTINGGALDRIFDIDPDTDGDPMTVPPLIMVNIINLTITNGRQNDIGGLRVNKNATVKIDNSTISNNRSWANDAGGVGNLGTLTMTNCTISGNTCLLLAGGIKNEGTLDLISCTVTNNDSDFDNLVGGLWNSSGTTTLRNTIVAGNSGVNAPNLSGIFTSTGYNIIGEFGTVAPTIVAGIGDQFDVSDAAVHLGALVSNGGPTMTHALGVGSIAIDQGESSGSTEDQRGLTRPCNLAGIPNATLGDGADVGAFEVQGPCVTNTAPVAVDNTYNINQDTLLNPAAPGVLGNDSDTDGDSLTAILVTGPSHAMSFALNANGSFSYRPTTSFTGVDTFTYKANDGQADSNIATVTINIADTEPPHITASVGQGSLWPPNHELINVGFNLNVTDNSAGPITTVIAVFSNEDDLFQGSGNAAPDAANIGAGTLQLRSERSGNGSGRVYLIRIVSTDPSDNESHECLTVVVPKGQSAAQISAVNAAAAAARAFCHSTGNPPPGYFVVGDGPNILPKQLNASKQRGAAVATSLRPLTEVMPQESPRENEITSLTFVVVPEAQEFGVKEYDDFHRVLHRLQHEALPKNDLATIRSSAKELLKLGDAIVKLGVPSGTKAESVESFEKALIAFKKALEKYGADAEAGTDDALKTSYSAVHESFEELAGMLPRK